MPNATDLEIRCVRIAKALRAPAHDEITMLRTARALKGIHAHLKRLVWESVKLHGWTADLKRCQHMLDLLERDLRRVLLEYSSLRGRQMYDLLSRATARSIATLDLLEG